MDSALALWEIGVFRMFAFFHLSDIQLFMMETMKPVQSFVHKISNLAQFIRHRDISMACKDCVVHEIGWDEKELKIKKER
jgi:hypothetical protein